MENIYECVTVDKEVIHFLNKRDITIYGNYIGLKITHKLVPVSRSSKKYEEASSNSRNIYYIDLSEKTCDCD